MLVKNASFLLHVGMRSQQGRGQGKGFRVVSVGNMVDNRVA